MNDLRTAAQQALEAMRRAVPTGEITLVDWMKANHDLEAALAEPVQPVAKVELMTTGGNAGLATRIVEIDDHLRDRLRPGQLLYAAPPQRPAEPVGVVTSMVKGGVTWHRWPADMPDGTHLYAAPSASVSEAPQRKPLSEDEIFAIENDIPDDVISDRAWTICFARAVEAAHGIKEGT
jgi:hypothetical protein